MKNIDFTQTGGFPLTQDQLGYMQTAWQEVVNSLAGAGAVGSAPYILSGMVTSTVFGPPISTHVSAGWFVYGGVAIRFPAQTQPITLSGVSMYIVITPAASSLLYNDGTVHSNVIQDVTGVLTPLPSSTPTDSTHFPLSALAPFGREAAFTTGTTTVSGPGSAVVTANISYRKNYLTNTIEGYIELTVNNPSSFSSIPYFSNVTIATLPIGYRPVTGPAYFNGTTTEVTPFGSGGTGYFNTLSGFLNTDGTLVLCLVNSTVSTYGGNFSFMLSLD